MAIICSQCGYAYNNDNTEHCSICNSSLHAQTNIHGNLSSNKSVYIHHGDELADSPIDCSTSINDDLQTNIQNNDYNIQETGSLENQPAQNTEHTLEGRISHIERNDEIPQRNIFSILSKLLIGILIFIPFLGLFVMSAFLSLAFAIFGFRSLSQLFNPFVWATSIFELLEIIVLRRISGTGNVPIYRGMVEDLNSQEHSFIFRGPMRAGNLVAGHNVRLSGHRERGTFITRGGMDLTSNAQIISDYRNPWRVIFWFVLIIYIFIGISIYSNLPEISGYFG